MLKCGFNKVAKERYYNHILARAFSYNFAAYLQNIFSQEHNVAASGKGYYICGILLVAASKFCDENGQGLLKILLKMF